MANRKRGGGGYLTHKEGCKCNACKSRLGQAQAIALSSGIGGHSVEALSKRKSSKVINADLPILTIPGKSPRDRVMQWMELRSLNPEIKYPEAAKQMGITARSLRVIIWKATREGWLKFDDPMDRLDNQIIPKVMDNLNKFVNEEDKVVTLEVAKGTIFKTYQDAKGISDVPTTVLALKIESANPENVKVITGHVVGRPKSIDE